MFGWLTHGGRETGVPADQRANGAPASHEGVDQLDQVAQFTTKRIESYGLLFQEMSGCRSPLEFAQLQQRWWLNAVQDYAGFAAGLYDRAAQTLATPASGEAEHGRRADHPSPETEAASPPKE